MRLRSFVAIFLGLARRGSTSSTPTSGRERMEAALQRAQTTKSRSDRRRREGHSGVLGCHGCQGVPCSKNQRENSGRGPGCDPASWSHPGLVPILGSDSSMAGRRGTAEKAVGAVSPLPSSWNERSNSQHRRQLSQNAQQSRWICVCDLPKVKNTL
ncbi:hypothetical protein QBC34DRAFT_120335 [Podospora aff. communis PSN243]|uniref:Secreted protein n=1 Tax=Podospora aff. communis PSN243 TaxID=3040156 RepID=A0AAV9GI59_9PEZI|nr:hypothetical protein QBC34DRAFT_120335 [Podospora aff. communis PSN243]